MKKTRDPQSAFVLATFNEPFCIIIIIATINRHTMASVTQTLAAVTDKERPYYQMEMYMKADTISASVTARLFLLIIMNNE
jgi:hypothetical protein